MQGAVFGMVSIFCQKKVFKVGCNFEQTTVGELFIPMSRSCVLTGSSCVLTSSSCVGELKEKLHDLFPVPAAQMELVVRGPLPAEGDEWDADQQRELAMLTDNMGYMIAHCSLMSVCLC